MGAAAECQSLGGLVGVPGWREYRRAALAAIAIPVTPEVVIPSEAEESLGRAPLSMTDCPSTGQEPEIGAARLGGCE